MNLSRNYLLCEMIGIIYIAKQRDIGTEKVIPTSHNLKIGILKHLCNANF